MTTPFNPVVGDSLQNASRPFTSLNEVFSPQACWRFHRIVTDTF